MHEERDHQQKVNSGVTSTRRATRNVLWAVTAGGLALACSTTGSFGDGGLDGGKSGLGANPSVPQTCQTCLTQSSTNECANKDKICSGDPGCVTLNTCINNCANINTGCITNCGNAASQDVIGEWNAWAQCTCGTCDSQCSGTFCGIGAGDGGADTGTDSTTCTADNDPCTIDGQCCSVFCASDGNCGCIAVNGACSFNSDCCSNDCASDGFCN